MILSDKIKVTYYCDHRKGYFTRLVLVDVDLDIQRKLYNCILKKMIIKNVASLVLMKLPGYSGAQIATSEASVPKYLFGTEYFRAIRKDVNNLWDFRKSAFIPKQL